MRRTTALVLASAVTAAGALALAPTAAAKDGDERLRASCSGASFYVAKVKNRDGGLRVDFWVKNNKVGQSWTYTLRQGGATVLTSTKSTRATDDDSNDDTRHTAEVKWRAFATGSGALSFRAVNAATGETCRAAMPA